MSELKTLFLSFGSWAVAAILFSLIAIEPQLSVVVVAPVFCLVFGWFYIPIVVYLHLAAYSLWPWFRIRSHGKKKFAFLGSLFAALLWSLIGSKEEGSVLRFTVAYAIAAFVSAFLAIHVITAFRDDKDGWPRRFTPLGASQTSAGPTKKDWWVVFGGLGLLLFLVLVVYLQEVL
ncbi:MAG: hypothetical protein ACOYMV_01560 [Verrucomicrobiia bacterium]